MFGQPNSLSFLKVVSDSGIDALVSAYPLISFHNILYGSHVPFCKTFTAFLRSMFSKSSILFPFLSRFLLRWLSPFEIHGCSCQCYFYMEQTFQPQLVSPNVPQISLYTLGILSNEPYIVYCMSFIWFILSFLGVFILDLLLRLVFLQTTPIMVQDS